MVRMGRLETDYYTIPDRHQNLLQDSQHTAYILQIAERHIAIYIPSRLQRERWPSLDNLIVGFHLPVDNQNINWPNINNCRAKYFFYLYYLCYAPAGYRHLGAGCWRKVGSGQLDRFYKRIENQATRQLNDPDIVLDTTRIVVFVQDESGCDKFLRRVCDHIQSVLACNDPYRNWAQPVDKKKRSAYEISFKDPLK